MKHHHLRIICAGSFRPCFFSPLRPFLFFRILPKIFFAMAIYRVDADLLLAMRATTVIRISPDADLSQRYHFLHSETIRRDQAFALIDDKAATIYYTADSLTSLHDRRQGASRRTDIIHHEDMLPLDQVSSGQEHLLSFAIFLGKQGKDVPTGEAPELHRDARRYLYSDSRRPDDCLDTLIHPPVSDRETIVSQIFGRNQRPPLLEIFVGMVLACEHEMIVCKDRSGIFESPDHFFAADDLPDRLITLCAIFILRYQRASGVSNLMPNTDPRIKNSDD